MLAAALLANAGRLPPPSALARIASPGAIHDAAAWGLAIRLARKFSGCTAEPLAGSSLRVKDGALVLAARPPFQALVTETIEKDLRQLAAWLKLEPAIEPLG